MVSAISWESLGKKTGLLPIISSVPKDNHSLMQHLDGFQNNFFTFLRYEKKFTKNNNNYLLPSQKSLLNKDYLLFYMHRKKLLKMFLEKNIPFRSFEINEMKKHWENYSVFSY